MRACSLVEPLGLGVHLLHGDLGGLAQADAERRRQGARAEAALLAAAARSAAPGARAACGGRRARRCPWARRSCGREMLIRSMFIASTSSGILPAACAASVWKKAFFSRQILPISASGWMTPISLFTAMIETTTVLSVIGRAQRVEIDQAVLLHRQVRDLEALLLEMAAGVEHALVLGHGGDDVVLAVLVELGDAADGEVVRTRWRPR